MMLTDNNNKIAFKPLLSLCIPTNGISEWVCPVLESIYTQNVDEILFEVVITDNGNNYGFKDSIHKYLALHKNIVYKKTDAYMFQNQVEAFKLAKGEFIKFINHRMTLHENALNHLIDFVHNNYEEKPIVFFLNNAMPMPKTINEYDVFEKFVENLSYYSSWSGGLAMWKSDFMELTENQEYNLNFPHITVLFSKKNSKKYIIDNTPLMQELPTDESKKGRYNLFQAFAVEYVSVINDLMRGGHITIDCFLKIKKDILGFISDLYIKYVVQKKVCSYLLDDYKKYINVYYNLPSVVFRGITNIIKRILKIH